jgi:DNA-binding transcriptional MerR regulator
VEQQLYTISQVAEKLGTSAQQIRRWEREGLIPPASQRIQRGARLDRRYTQADLDQLIELRWLFKVGAPTAEEAAERERRKQEFLRLRSSVEPRSGRLGE